MRQVIKDHFPKRHVDWLMILTSILSITLFRGIYLSDSIDAQSILFETSEYHIREHKDVPIAAIVGANEDIRRHVAGGENRILMYGCVVLTDRLMYIVQREIKAEGPGYITQSAI